MHEVIKYLILAASAGALGALAVAGLIFRFLPDENVDATSPDL